MKRGLTEVIEREAHNTLMYHAEHIAWEENVTLYQAIDMMTSWWTTVPRDLGVSPEALADWCDWARVQLMGGL